MGLSWDSLGPLLRSLGLSWATLGALLGFLGLSWALLGLSWATLGLSWGSLNSLLGSLGLSCPPLPQQSPKGTPWGIFRGTWGGGGPQARNFGPCGVGPPPPPQTPEISEKMLFSPSGADSTDFVSLEYSSCRFPWKLAFVTSSVLKTRVVCLGFVLYVAYSTTTITTTSTATPQVPQRLLMLLLPLLLLVPLLRLLLLLHILLIT